MVFVEYLRVVKNIETEDELLDYLKGSEEGETCDFNVALPVKGDQSAAINSSKSDFMGVCKLLGAFANTSGGILYLGVKEKNSLFAGIVGIELDNWEQFQKHLFEKLRSVFDPVIEGIFMKRILLDNGKYVVVIICPESDYLHQLILDGQPATFLKRVGPNTVAMTAAEVTAACIKKDKINKVANYRKERIDKLLLDPSGFGIQPPCLILHAIPDQPDIVLKTSEWEFKQRFRHALDSLIGKDGGGLIASTDRLCAEGIRFYTDSTRHLLITKKGGIELVCNIESSVDESVIHFGEWTKHSLALISQLLAQLAIEAEACQSWRFALTLIGVKGKKLRRGVGIFPFTSNRSLPQDRYELDFIKVEASISANEMFLQIEEKYHSLLESVWHDADAEMPKLHRQSAYNQV